MALQFFRALRATDMQSWEHPDPEVFTADGDYPNDPIAMSDVTPFVSEFVIRQVGQVDMNLGGTINPGEYGCGRSFRRFPLFSSRLGVKPCSRASCSPARSLGRPLQADKRCRNAQLLHPELRSRQVPRVKAVAGPHDRVLLGRRVHDERWRARKVRKEYDAFALELVRHHSGHLCRTAVPHRGRGCSSRVQVQDLEQPG